MTTIFFILWLADISTKLTVALSVIAVACFILACACASDDKRGAGVWLCICFLCIALAVLTPSEKTLRIFATAKAGEYIATTQLGEKALKALETKLDELVPKEKEKGTK